tara:strand:- start:407 stop:1033 length:627 start_codon:yes stop_codon:yes gene_type:complete
LDNQNHKILVGDFNYPEQIRTIINNDIKNNNYNILINNSGGPKSGRIIEADIEEFIETFNRHLICNHLLVQLLLPYMISTSYGRIINIISTSVKQPIVGLGVSNTIRSAVAAWSKTLSLEICNDGITVNNVLPGYTHTSRLDEIIKSKSIQSGLDIEEITAKLKKEVPLNRFADSNEIANLILFIASKKSGYINGVNIPIDGGRLKTF